MSEGDWAGFQEATEEPNQKWFLTVTLFPKECALTGKRIPMYNKAYLRKDGQIETWVSVDAFIFARLRGEI